MLYRSHSFIKAAYLVFFYINFNAHSIEINTSIPNKNAIDTISSCHLSDYYPLKENIRWKYIVFEKNKKYEQEVIIRKYDCKKCRDEKPSIYYVFDTKSIRKSKYIIKTTINSIQLHKTVVNDLLYAFNFPLIYSPPIPYFNLNPATPNKWFWEGEIKSLFINTNGKIFFEYIGFENVLTSLGLLNCVVISTKAVIGNDVYNSKFWYAKNIGLVKQKSDNYEKLIIEFSEK